MLLLSYDEAVYLLLCSQIKEPMKKVFVALLLLLAMAGEATAQRIKGSDTVLPLTQEFIENFLKTNPKSELTVTGGGSGVGISALLDETTDIAMASRPIKFSEKMKLSKGGKQFREMVVAYDALAVIVNPQNPVSKLTRQQLEDIFRGKITNWKEVGGPDWKIVVYSRETSSGTYEFFKESVLKNKNYMSGVLSMPATGAVIQSIRQTKGAIGYVGMAYLNRYVKPLAVSYDNVHYVLPSVETAVNKTYPVVRPLYYYYLLGGESGFQGFLDYVLSPSGQKIVLSTGYIPVN